MGESVDSAANLGWRWKKGIWVVGNRCWCEWGPAELLHLKRLE